jgi:hypothetical protein
MEVIDACGGGLDMHQKPVVACLMIRVVGQPPRTEVRTFRTRTAELWRLADWLQTAGGTPVAMASTGVYGRPGDTLLEGLLTLLVVTAQPSGAWTQHGCEGCRMDRRAAASRPLARPLHSRHAATAAAGGAPPPPHAPRAGAGPGSQACAGGVGGGA